MDGFPAQPLAGQGAGGRVVRGDEPAQEAEVPGRVLGRDAGRRDTEVAGGSARPLRRGGVSHSAIN
jgi:hypothetical protein